MGVIENSYIEYLPQSTRMKVSDNVKHFNVCELKQQKPRRFLFSIRDPIIEDFNHHLYADFVSLIDGNVLHIIDVGTGFQNGGFISKMDASTAWRVMRRSWVDVYAGAPDYNTADAGTNFNSNVFNEQALSMGTLVKIVPTEAHDRVGIVERSHTYLRRVYEKLRIYIPHIRREERLSMTFRAINDALCSDTGISPTTLVFGVFPKLPGGGPRDSMLERATIIRKCTELVTKRKARGIIGETKNKIFSQLY